MTRQELRKIISECIGEIISEQHDACIEEFMERRDRIRGEVVRDFLKGAKRIYWPTIKAAEIAKVWIEYGKYDRVDEDLMEKISNQMLDLVARLTVSTEIHGHTQVDAREELSDGGYPFTDKQWEQFQDTLVDKHGNWHMSDYGLKPLQNLAFKLCDVDTGKEKLQIVDRMLNVVHQRSDLADIFIQGGTSTLHKISSQGGHTTNFEDFNDQVRQQYSY